MARIERVGIATAGTWLLGAALVAVAIVWMAPSFACTYLPPFSASPARADPGTPIRVQAAEPIWAGAPVDVYWRGGVEGQEVKLATVPVQAGGTFVADVAVPANAVADGWYQIDLFQVQDLNPGRTGSDNRIGSIKFLASSVEAAVVTQDPTPTPAPAVEAAPSDAAAPAPAAQVAEAPIGAPADASGFSSSGVSAFNPGQIAPLIVDQPEKFGNRAPAGAGHSPWLLLPLGVAGLALFCGASAAAVRQSRRQGAPVRI